MKLNRRQKDGIADSFEKIGIAAAIGGIIGVFVEAKITLRMRRFYFSLPPSFWCFP